MNKGLDQLIRGPLMVHLYEVARGNCAKCTPHARISRLITSDFGDS